MGYMLETRGLTKRFGRGDQAQDAVADVSLHIREGEVYGLLGPNGAGKSTTLKMICGMLRPTAGEILFAGHAWRREDLYAIGSLIEEAPLYPNLTARENLRVRTTLLGLPESRVDEVLAAVDLAGTGKKRAGRFSMGMRQRLGLALALIARPRLLVLDEPTNGLDPIGIEELRDQIRGFAAAGTTVIVSSHTTLFCFCLTPYIIGWFYELIGKIRVDAVAHHLPGKRSEGCPFSFIALGVYLHLDVLASCFLQERFPLF